MRGELSTRRMQAVTSVLAGTILLGAVGAQAAIIESARVVKTIGIYSPGDAFDPQTSTNGSFSTILGSNPGFANEVGVDVVATASGGSFFFEHNLWRIGAGSAAYETLVETTLTNTGTTPAYLRFDSVITPGYIAVAGATGSGNKASFNFSIKQFTSGNSRLLYEATGLAKAGAMPIVATSGDDFKGLMSFSNPFDTYGLTWGATTVSVLLDVIAPGASTTIVYDLNTSVSGNDSTVPIGPGCQGSQVSFGDPRNPGGGSASIPLFAAAMSALGPVATAPCGNSPVIGRRFDPFEIPVKISSVPEPSSWAMLIVGFGAVGTCMRRRRSAAIASGRSEKTDVVKPA